MAKESGRANKKGARDVPWSIRGIGMEARTAALKAAQREGLTLGEWVERVIWDAAQADLKDQGQGNSRQVMIRVEDQLAAISGKLDELQRPFWKRMFGKGQP